MPQIEITKEEAESGRYGKIASQPITAGVSETASPTTPPEPGGNVMAPVSGFGKGVLEGLSFGAYDPTYTPEEQGYGAAGKTLSGIGVNVAPYLTPAGPVLGPLVNAAYFGADAVDQQMDQGRTLSWGQPDSVHYGPALGQAALGGVMGKLPPYLGKGLPSQVLTGGALGAAAGLSGQALDQLGSTGQVQITPEMLQSGAIGGAIGGGIPVAGRALGSLLASKTLVKNPNTPASLQSIDSVLGQGSPTPGAPVGVDPLKAIPPMGVKAPEQMQKLFETDMGQYASLRTAFPNAAETQELAQLIHQTYGVNPDEYLGQYLQHARATAEQDFGNQYLQNMKPALGGLPEMKANALEGQAHQFLQEGKPLTGYVQASDLAPRAEQMAAEQARLDAGMQAVSQPPVDFAPRAEQMAAEQARVDAGMQAANQPPVDFAPTPAPLVPQTTQHIQRADANLEQAIQEALNDSGSVDVNSLEAWLRAQTEQNQQLEEVIQRYKARTASPDGGPPAPKR